VQERKEGRSLTRREVAVGRVVAHVVGVPIGLRGVDEATFYDGAAKDGVGGSGPLDVESRPAK